MPPTFHEGLRQWLSRVRTVGIVLLSCGSFALLTSCGPIMGPPLLTRQGQAYKYLAGATTPLFGQAEKAQVPGEDKLDARTLQELRRLEAQQNRLAAQHQDPEAIRVGQQMVDLLTTALGPAHALTTAALANLGPLYDSQGNYREALAVLQRAAPGLEKTLGPAHLHTLNALTNLVTAYDRVGDYAQALPLSQRVVSLHEQHLGREHPDTAMALYNQALVSHHMGNDLGLIAVDRAGQIWEQALGPVHPALARALVLIAQISVERGDYAHGLQGLQGALLLLAQTLGPTHPETAQAIHTVAMVSALLKEYGQAQGLAEQAVKLLEQSRGPEHPETLKAVGTLALVYAQRGHTRLALPLAQRAVTGFERTLGPDHQETANALSHLAALHGRLGDYRQAMLCYERSLSAQDRMFAQAFRVASEEQKIRFVTRAQGIYQSVLAMIVRHLRQDPTAVRLGLELVLRRKGLVQDAQSQVQLALAGRLEGDTLAAWERWAQHRSTIAGLLLRGTEARSAEAYGQALLEQAFSITQEEQFLAERSSGTAQTPTQALITIQRLVAHLPKTTALVEFVRLEEVEDGPTHAASPERYIAFVLTPDSQVTLVDLGEAKRIDTQITTTLARIQATSRSPAVPAAVRQAEAALADLSAQILRPLASSLGGVAGLIVSPDSELNLVPFAALSTPDGRYLVEQLTLSYVATGRDLLLDPTGVPATMDLLLVANPTFDTPAAFSSATRPIAVGQPAHVLGPFTSLPGTAEEALRIPPLVKGMQKAVLEGMKATEAAVRTVRSPRILHLATHGFFVQKQPGPSASRSAARDLMPVTPPAATSGSMSGTPPRDRAGATVRFSGLALAGANYAAMATTGDDGLLTDLEVASMQLYGTDLVVLSACETARGEARSGEGVYGLRRAFVMAGARNLVMSLWPVSDEATVTHMEHFYRAYGQGASATDALRRAQLQTITELRKRTQKELGEALAPVHLWAPFIVQQRGS